MIITEDDSPKEFVTEKLRTYFDKYVKFIR